MSSGLLALLDDVAAIARLAAASLDDVSAAAGKASAKAAGVVIDDTAVTPRYVTGLLPERELPIIWKIARGSLFNKLVILLPAALLLSAFAPFLITPILMLGGAYLAFEAMEKITEKLLHDDHHHEEELVDAMADPAELEKMQVKGAIRTDLILSAEIMAIALATLGDLPMITKAAALVAVALAVTLGVYGVVALIVKLDDIGLHLAQRGGSKARFGEWLVNVVPSLLSGLSGLGTAAMLWVGGGILLHGLHDLHILTPIPDTVDHLAELVAHGAGALAGIAHWVVEAIGGALLGALIGGVIVLIVRQFTSHPEDLVVDA